jgi:hypothetical protein
MNPIASLTPQELRRAADIKEKIQSIEKELNQLLGAPAEIFVEAAPRKKRRRLSAQAIANIRAGARKRWGKLPGRNRPVEPRSKGKRKMSAAQKARLSAIAKARWKKVRAQGKNAL